MMFDHQDFEDDVAEMVECMATDALQDGGSTEAIKQQFRDALAKFIDERIEMRAVADSIGAPGEGTPN